MHEETVYLNEKLNQSVVDNEDDKQSKQGQGHRSAKSFHSIPSTHSRVSSLYQRQLLERESVTAMEGIPDLEMLVTGNNSGIIKFWKVGGNEVETKNYLKDPKLHNGKILSIMYLSSIVRKFIFTGGEDSNFVAIVISEDDKKWEVRKINKYPINSITFTQVITGDITSICNACDGKHVFYSIGSKIAVFRISTMEIVNIQEYQVENINTMVYLDDLKLLIYSTDFNLKAINPFESDITYSFSLDLPLTHFIACKINNQHCFIATLANTSKIVHFTFENEEFKKIKTYEVQGSINKLLYCYDKRTFIIVMKEGVFYLQNIENAKIKKKLVYDQTLFSSGCYLCDGSTIAIANVGGKIDFFKSS